MLESLHIRNIALIEDETLEFHAGFSVLTGETGAGKSIIIGALNFVLGERVSGKELIRFGAEKASVEAVFSCDCSETIERLLKDNEIDHEDGTLILTRDLSLSGRSVCRINGYVVPLTVLKQLGDLLIDIHGQHEHQSLLDVKTHQRMLDRYRYSEIWPLLEATGEAFKRAKDASNAMKALDMNEREREYKLDLLRHQMNEIDAAHLQTEEEDLLMQRKRVLMNSQKIIDSLAFTNDAFKTEDGIMDRLSASKRSLTGLSDISSDYAALAERLEDAYYTLEDIADSVHALFETSAFDENELDEVEQRLALIHTFKRKYGKEINEILSYRESIGIEYDSLCDIEMNRDALAKAYDKKLSEYKKYAARLSLARHHAAEEMKNDLMNELSGLGMPHASFEVQFSSLEGDIPSEYGTEQIEFMLSANKGESPKPLAKVASGGEVSRIMLAFKRVLADSDEIPTMIFDEIDTGISGMVGNAVAQKMLEISRDRQVICITHLPQIAAAADCQYHVFKTETGERTVSGVSLLNEKERPAEIARIMGSDPTDSIALEHAVRMIQQSKNR